MNNVVDFPKGGRHGGLGARLHAALDMAARAVNYTIDNGEDYQLIEDWKLPPSMLSRPSSYHASWTDSLIAQGDFMSCVTDWERIITNLTNEDFTKSELFIADAVEKLGHIFLAEGKKRREQCPTIEA